MKYTLNLIFKGILLYTTFIVCILSAIGIDDIYDKRYFFINIVICAGLIYACHKTISKEEVDILLPGKYPDKEEEDDKWQV